MILDIFLSLIILPAIWSVQLNTDGFLNLNNQANIEISQAGPNRVYTDYLDVKISAKSAIAVDARSGKILYKKNEQEILPLASITKLMTALVFLEHNPGWQTEWSIISADRRSGNVPYLHASEVLTLDNLFKTALIVSDNDAAVALARTTGMSEEAFVKNMNLKAQAIGMFETHFADPTGLFLANKSNVAEVVKLLNVALQNQDIAQTTSTSYYEFEVTGSEKSRLVKLRNTDSLLNGYLNILGGKTGTLNEAGYNLAVKIQAKNKQQIFVVVLGSQSNRARVQDIKAITDWVLANYEWPVN